MTRGNRWRRIGALVVAVWLVVVALHARREYFKPVAIRLEEGARLLEPGSHFYLARMGGVAIGMASSRLDTIPGGFRLSDQLIIDIPAQSTTQRAVVETRADLSPGLELRDFVFRLDSDLGRFEVRGEARGDTIIELEVGAGGESERSTLRVADGVVLPAVLPYRLAAAGLLREGAEHRVRIFDPSTLTDREATFRVLGREEKVIPDTAAFDPVSGEWSVGSWDTIPVWRIEEEHGTMRLLSWVDEDGRLVRSEGSLGFSMERTAAELARAAWNESRNDPTLASGYGAVIEGTAISSSVDLGRVGRVDQLRVRLLGVDLTGFDLAGGRQVLKGDTLLVSTEDLARIDAGYRLPYRGGGEPAEELASTPLIQASDPRIVETARRVVGEETDPVVAATKLSEWVYGALRKEVTLSLPSAVQVLEAGRGDCNEHTVLYIALARALGLPARTAVGVVHVDGRFYYHAWPEVWLDGWVAVDPTLGQDPADASHLRFLVGGLERQVELVRLIGRLRLEVL